MLGRFEQECLHRVGQDRRFSPGNDQTIAVYEFGRSASLSYDNRQTSCQRLKEGNRHALVVGGQNEDIGRSVLLRHLFTGHNASESDQVLQIVLGTLIPQTLVIVSAADQQYTKLTVVSSVTKKSGSFQQMLLTFAFD
jgi:hypothetical protein